MLHVGLLYTFGVREVSEDCSNLNRAQCFSLVLDSLFLSLRLVKSMEHQRWLAKHGKCDVKMSAKIDRICHMSWRRHWRRVAYFAKTFGEYMYIPEWYLADNEVK